MSPFRSMPIFRAAPLAGTFTAGGDALRLTEAMRMVWKASPDAFAALEPAAQALGDPFNRERRERALAILEALPARLRAKILAAYGKKGADAESSSQPARAA
ncbi:MULTISPECIES: hypothetical protein [Methylobacterium]|nr:hypothetical protein [Methylobacterium aquaticum]